MSSFIYVVQTQDLTISERVQAMTESLMPLTLDRRVGTAMLWDDVIRVVRRYGPLPSSPGFYNVPPVIDYHGEPYTHLAYLVDMLSTTRGSNNSVDCERLIYGYIETVEYVVANCWIELVSVIAQIDPSHRLEVTKVEYRDSTVALTFMAVMRHMPLKFLPEDDLNMLDTYPSQPWW